MVHPLRWILYISPFVDDTQRTQDGVARPFGSAEKLLDSRNSGGLGSHVNGHDDLTRLEFAEIVQVVIASFTCINLILYCCSNASARDFPRHLNGEVVAL